ncbi:hypothetical protein L4D20_03715 [Vibrio kyushuensis]|uniref:hypothetical protein n=1 Tax=Vibrio kyushuensis TaxID=2910249 RepID=UPI003D0D464B
MENVDTQLMALLSDPLFNLADIFRPEHSISIFHRQWGKGEVLNVISRPLGGFYIDIEYSNHVKTILSTSLSGYLIKNISIDCNFLEMYLGRNVSQENVPVPSLQSKGSVENHIISTSTARASDSEEEQLSNYIKIFHRIGASQLHEVNQYIEQKNKWNDFHLLRSKNTHANGSTVNGIAPKHYKYCCEELGINAGNGTPLTNYKLW